MRIGGKTKAVVILGLLVGTFLVSMETMGKSVGHAGIVPGMVAPAVLSPFPVAPLQGSNGWELVSNVVRLTDSSDQVAIGLNNPDGGSKLDVRGQFMASTATTNGFLAFYAQGDAGGSGITKIGATSGGTQGRGPLAIQTADVDRIYIDTEGRVGVGINSPDPGSRMDVRGQFMASEATASGFLALWVQGDVSGVTKIGATSGGSQGRGPLAIQTNDSDRIYIEVDGDVGIGTSTPGSKLEVNGETRTKCLTITGGCDLSEPFEVTEPSIEPGMVVSIDPAHEGKLRLARTAYDTTVAGVLSGAGGVKTGMVLSQSEVFETGKLVALTGRVYVWCDASFGEIKPGDLLTTSTTPGHAMKASDREKTSGAILGKSLGSLSKEKGLVLIVVSLQ